MSTCGGIKFKIKVARRSFIFFCKFVLPFPQNGRRGTYQCSHTQLPASTWIAFPHSSVRRIKRGQVGKKTKRLSEKTQFRSGLKYCAGSAKEIVCRAVGVLSLPRVPPPNAGASSLTLLISIFHQVLWHISNFHLGKIITQQREAHKKLNPHLLALVRSLAALRRYWRADNVLYTCMALFLYRAHSVCENAYAAPTIDCNLAICWRIEYNLLYFLAKHLNDSTVKFCVTHRTSTGIIENTIIKVYSIQQYLKNASPSCSHKVIYWHFTKIIYFVPKIFPFFFILLLESLIIYN